MEWYDVVVRHFFVLFIESFDEVNVFRDRGDDNDVRSGEIFFIESFAEKLWIELQCLFDEISGKRILFDEIIGLVPILNDTIIFVHLFQCSHPQVERVHRLIESVLDFYRFARMLSDIEQDKIIFFQIIPQKQERMEWLGKNMYIVLIEKISIDRVDDVRRFFIEIDDIEPEEYFSGFTDDIFFLFSVDMDIVYIDHDSFTVDIIMFLGGFAFVLYDIF